MNVTLGTKLSDGRRVGIEWRCVRGNGRTTLQAFLTHEGDLSDDDLSQCLTEIGEDERLAHAAEGLGRRRHAIRRRSR